MVDLLATVAARIEESAYHNGVILSNFLRSIRLDGYSCGAKSFYTILKYFGKRRTPLSVERELHTTVERTSIRDIKRVLKRHGLKDRREDP
jgi:predicted double-glycine peptidase